ncbi:MAG: glycosyltransferase family 2 protein [Rothia sp. (in: high G+C Gram-positive bacteria)]|nr:glycosyltransferase family 2 protein [Rothia sp. (in: high G+C Gram-positive bacteria)]
MPNNSAPRTSIIMPVYNTAEQVIGSIRSVLAQSDPDFELLILNDQSPDNAHEVIEQFLAENPDPRVRYVLNSVNMGISKTRNHGINLSRGQWLTFLDSDDAFKPNFLQTMHAGFNSAYTRYL